MSYPVKEEPYSVNEDCVLMEPLELIPALANSICELNSDLGSIPLFI
jgi:hypothetical protein